jgi:hypothetical protein
MTAEDKRDRRKARHEMQELFRKETMRGGGLYMTPNQLRDRVKVLVDRCVKGDIPLPSEQPQMSLEVRAQLALAGMVKEVV